jgi:endogenous inhibitor of DNA gyrase (YacG/DUF329 family)
MKVFQSKLPDSAMANEPKCPICKRPVEERFKPFCSKRCAHVDLGRWLKGGYAIAATESEEEDDQPSSDTPPEHEH